MDRGLARPEVHPVEQRRAVRPQFLGLAQQANAPPSPEDARVTNTAYLSLT
jgi:hypothetical protein